ncbi:triose/dihydroxyacetone kinase / FAD-AMP lyase [Fistulifera solaris]|uniref:Triose/dihydroxyacetone kinase / FAD-AMP lyase n=1 Tax=Fistulifera solaris TaxID=1519565 RepID=A0A1Z5K6L6_FISSO|nr:triose/dihydroxyacetone kinase / FAD-AMP lyase [Fistulifera solaris]|eukprot:GAX21731.1 triose/dihydroxyacetone kinase / FAD-AMP lyase [Fistulifera solaris]
MTANKKIINCTEDAVAEMIQGLLRQYPETLKCCEAPYQNILIGSHYHTKERTAASFTPISLISGGGSGHEPSHAGWIGCGMLTSVVCGGIFASPSIAAIRAALRAVPSDAGILVIVKNYTGDCLNFGMAIEMENTSNNTSPIEMVVVAEDVALPREKGVTGARGLAGTVLIHKIAGAAAAAGYSLSQVATLARNACARMGTLGIALETVAVPGAPATSSSRLPDDCFEVGLGIHGEAGLKQCPAMTANEMATTMIVAIQSYGRIMNDDDDTIVPMFASGDEVCVLVNNLGGTSEFEMSILANACVTELEAVHHVKVRLLYVGTYMSSFNMHGASLTILNLTDEMIELLEAPTSAPAWKKCQYSKDPNAMVPVPVPPELKTKSTYRALPPLMIQDFSTVARKMVAAAAQSLIDHEPLITKYDTIVGDGDCGLTMKRGAVALLKCKHLDTSHPVRLFTQIADLVSSSMGGTSGVLLELGFRKMATYMSRAKDRNITARELFAAFQQGVQAISFYGRATLGARTMLDALIPASRVENADLLQGMAQAARHGADSTATMGKATAGRSNYLSEVSLQGTPDPGAIAMALVLEAIAASVSS